MRDLETGLIFVVAVFDLFLDRVLVRDEATQVVWNFNHEEEQIDDVPEQHGSDDDAKDADDQGDPVGQGERHRSFSGERAVQVSVHSQDDLLRAVEILRFDEKERPDKQKNDKRERVEGHESGKERLVLGLLVLHFDFVHSTVGSVSQSGMPTSLVIFI